MSPERKAFLTDWALILIGVWTMVFLLLGCARFATVQNDVSYDENGMPQRQITTRAAASTFLAGKTALSHWKASQTDKSQGASVGALAQETSATNVVEALRAIDSILGRIRP